MNAESVVAVARTAMETTLLISAPMLVSGLVVGLLVSIFQAVTSIQEMTLTFIPKIVAVFLTLLIMTPWMIHTLSSFAGNVFSTISTF